MFRVLLVLGCLVSAVSAQSLERSIGLPDSLGVMGFSHRMAFDPVHDKLYAAGTGALSILGGPGGRRIGLVRAPAAGDPFYAGLHLDAQRNRLYWVRGYDTIISIVSTESNSVVGQLMTRPVSMLRHGEFAACIDTVNHRLYASTLDGLAVFDISADTFIYFIASNTNFLTGEMCVNPYDRRLYVRNDNDVHLFHTGPDTLVKVLPVWQGSWLLRYLKCSNRVFVGSYPIPPPEPRVTIIDGAGDSVRKTVPVGVLCLRMELNETDGKVYVGGYGGTTVVDGWGDSVRVHTPTKFASCWNSRLDKTYMYGEDTVWVVDGKSDSIEHEVSCAFHYVLGTGCNPDAGMVYFTSWNSALLAFDCATDTVGWRERSGRVLSQMVWSPRNRRVFGLDSFGLASVSLDPGTPPLLREWYGASRLALAPDESKLYLLRDVNGAGWPWLYVASCATLELLDSIRLMDHPTALYVVPGRPRVYCPVDRYPEPAIDIIDTERDSLVREIRGVEGSLFAYSEASHKVYLLDYPRLHVLDAERDSLLRTLSLAGSGFSYAMCWHPASNRLYVSTTELPRVRIIDCESDSVVGSIASVPTSGYINYSPPDDRLYLLGWGGTANEAVVECGTNRYARAIATGADYTVAPVYNPRGNKLYLADAPWGSTVPKAGTAVVVDCARDAVSARLDLAGGIVRLAVVEDSGIVLAACADARLNLIRDTTMTGVFGDHVAGFKSSPSPTIIRGVLWLAGAGQSQCVGRTGLRDSPCAVLLDAAGRKVMELLPGPNDVRHLAPGVYFVRASGNGCGSVRRIQLMR